MCLINNNNNEYLIRQIHGKQQQYTVKLWCNVTIKDVAYRVAKEQNHS